MSIESNSRHANSRRTFLAGATAAGVSAIGAFHAPAAALAFEASEKSVVPVKLVAALRRRPDLSKADFYDYWLNQHGPLAAELVQKLGAYRYVQSHTNNKDLGLLLAKLRGQLGRPFDGVTEVWFPSRAVLEKALASPTGMEANLRLARDEANFIDLPRSSYSLTGEHVLLG